MLQGKINIASILAEAKANSDDFEDKLIEAFEYIGDEQVSANRDGGNYKDRTGNLRHSLYYTVKQNGREVSSKSEAVGGITEAAVSKAKRSKGRKKGIELVVGAGMNYAAALQALEGFTVIKPVTKDQIERDLSELL